MFGDDTGCSINIDIEQPKRLSPNRGWAVAWNTLLYD